MNVRAYKLRPIVEHLRRGSFSRWQWGAVAALPGLALAGPSGEQVVAGSAAISRPSLTHTQVDQASARAVVNWSTFSVANEEYVVFNQPGASASILNRVVGSQQSQIFGQIQANGQIFLVNPQGVYFAPGSKVDVGSLSATVLDITNEDFMSGHYAFTRGADAVDGASVENAGEIKVGDGGYVVLAGDYANNTGVISARLGSVVLAAGARMTLDLSDDGLVSFAVDEETVSSLAGVNNAGEIVADGGRVIMTAKVANDLLATAVNNDGLLQAHRIVEDGGEIYLTASGGDIAHSGTIDVGGEGDNAGGEVGILGDENIALATGSRIDADGAGSGDGGSVNVIADGRLAFRRDAEITAIAGASGERGGHLELSGYDQISLQGDVSLGAGGDLVIDPTVVTLKLSAYGGPSTGSSYATSVDVGTYIEVPLNSGTEVIVAARDRIDASSNVASINATGGGDLKFLIGRFFSSSDSGSSSSTSPTGDVDLPGVSIDIAGDLIVRAGTSTGSIAFADVTANNVVMLAGSGNGNITLTAGGITAESNALFLGAPGGNITIGDMAPGNLSLSGFDLSAENFTTFSIGPGVSFSVPHGINVRAGGDFTVNGNIDATASFGVADVIIDAAETTIEDVNIAGYGGANLVINATGNVTLGSIDVNPTPSSLSYSDNADGRVFVDAVDFAASGDVIVYAARNASVTINATTADIAVQKVEAEIGNSAMSNGGSARIDLTAAGNVTAMDIEARSGRGSSAVATVNINATAGKVDVNEVTAAAIGAAYYGGINIDAGTSIDAGNLQASVETSGRDGPDAVVILTAGTSITANSIDATAGVVSSGTASSAVIGSGSVSAAIIGGSGDASVVITGGTGNVVVDDITVRGASDASAIASGDVDVTVRDITVEAANKSGSISMSASNNLIVNGATSLMTADGGNLVFSAGNTVVVNGRIDVMHSGSGGSFDLFIDGNNGVTLNEDASLQRATGVVGPGIVINAPGGDVTTQGLSVMTPGAPAAINIEANSDSGTVTVDGLINIAGDTAHFIVEGFDVNLRGGANLNAAFFAGLETVADNDVTTQGDFVLAAAGGNASVNYEYANIGTFGNHQLTSGPNPADDAKANFGSEEAPGIDTTITGNVSVTGTNDGEINVFTSNELSVTGTLNASGNDATIDLNASIVDVTGAVTLTAMDDADLDIQAMSDVTLAGAVVMNGATAVATYLYNGDGIFGNHTLTATTTGGALAGFGLLEDMTPIGANTTLNGDVVVSGGTLGGAIYAAALNTLTANGNLTVSADNSAILELRGATVNILGGVSLTTPGTQDLAFNVFATGDATVTGGVTVGGMGSVSANYQYAGSGTFGNHQLTSGTDPTSDAKANFGSEEASGIDTTITGNVSVTGTNDGEINVFTSNELSVTGTLNASGNDATIDLNASIVDVTGAVTLTAMDDADFDIQAMSNVTLTGNVVMNGATAVATYLYNGDGIFGNHTLTATAAGGALAGFGLLETMTPVAANTTLNGDVVVSGGAQGGAIYAAAINTLTANGNLTVSADNLANLELRGATVNVLGGVSLTTPGTQDLAFNVFATGDATVTGGVTVGGMGSVSANYQYAGSGTFGAHQVSAGPGGNATLKFGLDDGIPSGMNTTIDGNVVVSGGLSTELLGGATNDLIVTGTLEAVAGSVLFELVGGNVSATDSVTITATTGDAQFDVSAGNNARLTGPVTLGAAGNVFANYVYTGDGLFGDQSLTSGPGGEAIAIFGEAEMAPVGANTTLDGNVTIAGGTKGELRASATNLLAVNGMLDVSGAVALVGLNAADITVAGGATIAATSESELQVTATNNVSVLGGVTMTEVGGGEARARYLFGNQGVFGAHSITAGPGGNAIASFGGEMEPGQTARLDGPVTVNGGLGGTVQVNATNSIVVNGALAINAAAADADLFLRGANVDVNAAVSLDGMNDAQFEIASAQMANQGNASVVDIAQAVEVTARNDDATFVINGASVNVSGAATINGGSDASFRAGRFGRFDSGSVNLAGTVNVAGNSAFVGMSAANVNVNGNVGVNGANTGSAQFWINALAFVDNGQALTENGGTVNLNVPLSISGGTAAAVIAGSTVNLNQAIAINGTNANVDGSGPGAALAVGALGSIALPTSVSVTGADGATAAYFHGGDAVFGRQTVSGGAGSGQFLVGEAGNVFDGLGTEFPLRPAIIGNAVAFNQLVKVTGASSRIGIKARNSIRTQNPAGLLEANAVALGVSNSGTTLIDVKTKTAAGAIRNTGLTPNVRYDNRAFIGPSSIDFGGGTLIKSGNFFATGPLTFLGNLTADNLSVAVTAGTATFDGLVHITGATPLPLTAPDLDLFALTSSNGLVTPTHGPNVLVFAQNGINMPNTFNISGPTPYVKLITNGPFNTPGLTTDASSIMTVFTPVDTSRPVFFEEDPFSQPLGASGVFADVAFAGLPNNGGTTVVIGELGPVGPILNGPFTLGSNGPIDLGARNGFVITRGQVTGGETSVTTSGIFEIVGLAADTFFQVPIIDEFGDQDTSENDDDDEDEGWVLGDGDDGEGDDTEVSEGSSGSESMECEA